MDAIYARQSVDKADSLSIQGQIDLCRREVGREVQVFQDKGFSGKNTNRPDFQRMMADVEKGIVQKIVVYRLDRFSRSLADFSRLWEVLQRHGVEFVSVNERFDTSTPMGRAMLSIIMVFAQLERETTAERVRDNYYQRVKLGSWPGGPAPYGFSIGRIPDAMGKLSPALIPNENMEVVKRIFDAYVLAEASLGSVARMLNANGIPAPKRATWDNVTLSRILHSPLYVMADEEIYLHYKAKGIQLASKFEAFDGIHAGMIIGKRDRSVGKYQSLKDQHLSIANHCGVISSKVWIQCQNKLDGNRQLRRKGSGKHTWLSGLLKCGCCGYSVKVNKDGNKYYLVCSGRSNLGLCKQAIRVDLRTLEESVAAELERLLAECPDIEADTYEDQAYTSSLEEIDQKINRLIDALTESSDITMAYVNRAIQKLEGQKQALLDERARRQSKPSIHLRRVQFAPLNFEEKKMVAAQFVKEINLVDDRAEVIWNV